MALLDAESSPGDPPEHPAAIAAATPTIGRSPVLTVILAPILLEFRVSHSGHGCRAHSLHPQPGHLWHADHAGIPQSPSPVSAVPPVAPCSRTAIGSWPSMARYAPIAVPRPRQRPLLWTMFVPAADRPRTIGRTTWFSLAGTATQPRPIRLWSRFSCSAGPAGCFSCTTENTCRSRFGNLPDRHRNGRFSRKSNGDGADARGRPASRPLARSALGLDRRREGLSNDPTLFGRVRRGVSLRRAGPLGTPDVRHLHPRRRQLPQLRLDVGPGAHVPRLLLDPDQLLQLGILRQHRPHLGPGKRIELFQPDDGGTAALHLVGLAEQVVVELAAAQHQPRHLARPSRDRRIVQHGPPAAAGQLVELRVGLRET